VVREKLVGGLSGKNIRARFYFVGLGGNVAVYLLQ
jgi:hypothetical protein